MLPGASGSSTINAKLWLFVGAPLHFNSGEMPSASQEYFLGMVEPSENALLVKTKLLDDAAIVAEIVGDGDANGAHAEARVTNPKTKNDQRTRRNIFRLYFCSAILLDLFLFCKVFILADLC